MIVGIDEVGRGCWAGPLVAVAVVLKKPIVGLKDSKKLSQKRRQFLAEQIKKCSFFGIGIVSNQQIDKFGLTHATSLAMKQALSQIPDSYSEVIIDGNYNYLPDIKSVRVEIKADDKYLPVSAASILAKEIRDNIMKQESINYPAYGFENHVGYGTQYHIEQLKLHGICKLHRKSFKPIQQLIMAL